PRHDAPWNSATPPTAGNCGWHAAAAAHTVRARRCGRDSAAAQPGTRMDHPCTAPSGSPLTQCGAQLACAENAIVTSHSHHALEQRLMRCEGLRQCGDAAVYMLLQDLDRTVAEIGFGAGEQLEEDHAQAVQVAARIKLQSLRLFRAHVIGRAAQHTGTRA